MMSKRLIKARDVMRAKHLEMDGMATVSQALAAERGGDPESWLREGARIGFEPGLIPETFRWTNRSTFQQVLQFGPGIGAN